MQSRVDLSLVSITSSSEFDEHGAYAEARVRAVEIRDERVVGYPVVAVLRATHPGSFEGFQAAELRVLRAARARLRDLAVQALRDAD